jgi:hypothetical protein
MPVKLNGSTSGSVTVQAPAVAGTNTLTLPAATGNLLSDQSIVPGSASVPTNGMYLPAANALGFATNSTNAMYIDASQNVGIGTTSPAVKLQIGSSSTSTQSENIDMWGALAGSNGDIGRIRFYNVNAFGNKIVAQVSGARDGNNYGGALLFSTGTQADTTLTERMRIDSGGNLLVGATAAAANERQRVEGSVANNLARFVNTNAGSYGVLIQYGSGVDPNGTSNEFITCNGNLNTARFAVRSNGGIANFSANNVNLSDERVKKDIQLAGSYLDKICAIPVKTFLYKDQTDNDLNLGVIAQDVEAIAPELVSNDGFGTTPEDGVPYKTIYQTDLQYALMKSIQELSAKNDALEARLAALEAK